jgi:hypothetical protein
MIQTPSVKAIKLFFVADTVENKLECLALTNSSSLLANISLAWKNLSGISTVAYSAEALVTKKKVFTKLTPGGGGQRSPGTYFINILRV